jgi:hypothetical protein
MVVIWIAMQKYNNLLRFVPGYRKRGRYIIDRGAEVGLCTSSWERLGNLHSRANVETQGGRTLRAGEV